MKKILSLIMISCLCFCMVSCGNATLSGDTAVFKNANASFSIELPAGEEGDKGSTVWNINEESDGDILDMTDSKETVRVVVQGIAKQKVVNVAADFEGYKTYITENAFAELLNGAKLKDTSIDVPEFAKNSAAYKYSGKKTEGVIVFMESDRAYYTYLVIAADGGYSANEKALKDSILSLKELSAESDSE